MMMAGLYTPEAMKDLVDQYLAGDKSAAQGFGFGPIAGQNRKLFRDMLSDTLHKLGKGGNDVAAAIAEFQGITAGERTLGNRGTNIKLAGQEFDNTVPLALAASDQVARSGFLPFGKAQNMFDTNTNDKNLSAFAAYNNALVNQYASAVSRTGVPTVFGMQHAYQLLSTAKDQEAYKATVMALQQEIRAALASPSQVKQEIHESITGKKIPTTNNATNVNQNKATSGKTFTLNEDDMKLFKEHYKQ